MMKKIEVYVPTQDMFGRKLDEEKRQFMLNVVKRDMARLAGGYTLTEATGGYLSDDGQFIEENVTIVYAYKLVKDEDMEKIVKQELFNLASQILYQLNQESVMTVYDNVPTFHA